MKIIKVGIVGCGAMGSFLAKRIERDFKKKAKLSAIFDIDKNRLSLLNLALKTRPAVLSLKKLIIKSDLVVEAASGQASYKIALAAIRSGKDVLVMSVGGLLGKTNLFKLAKEKKCTIYMPSGAIAGIDALKAASIGKINKVVLTTRKPPQALKGAPFIRENNIDLKKIKNETVIFQGTAREAARGFPQNINVAATLSLAGVGEKFTRVRIISSPEYSQNIHEIEVIGEFGRFVSRTENIPSRENPKTSYLAMLSALATLKQILSPLKIGT